MHRIGYSTMTIVRPEFCFGGHYSGFAASNRTETAVPSPIGRNATCQMLRALVRPSTVAMPPRSIRAIAFGVA